ncbi:chemotaxis protein CheW [Anaerovorax odorimutans]|uniref:chemotaxis protein CheW n=1 Tax=Anaerovorax odorimutans TaxID=109327 RepID=UPI00041E072A|nr:chemotaxis protein CheW [Anaerovorax odorimutans]
MALEMKKEAVENDINEIEIMEFTIDGDLFGIRVEQVREIMMPSSVREIPLSHPAVEGVFKPRDTVITVINLPRYLNLEEENNSERNLFIVTDFKGRLSAFRVHTVVGIDRITEEALQKPDKTIYGGGEGVVVGLAQCENRLLTILDFEKIVAEISVDTDTL